MVLVGAIAALNFYAPARPDGVERALASLLLLGVAAPTWWWLSGADDGLPFMPLFAMIYGAYFALPLFLLNAYSLSLQQRSLSDASVRGATALGLAGLVSLLAGYYGFRLFGFDLLIPRARLRWRERNLQWWGIAFGLAGLATFFAGRLTHVPKALIQAVVVGGNLALIATAILLILQLTRQSSTFASCLLWIVVVPLRALLGLSTGATAQLLVVFLLILFTACTIRGRILWGGLFVGALSFGVVRPLMQPFRMAAAQGDSAERSSELEHVVRLGKVAANFARRPVDPNILFQFSLQRLAHILTFAEVVRDTPDHVPYWGGETYLPLLYKPVPRLIFPNKPEENAGQNFGHRYGLLDPRDGETSYNLLQVEELYVNFGPAGVIVGMFILGVLYQVTQRVFVHPEMGIGALVSAIYTLSGMFDMESNASLVLGGLMVNFVFIAVINQVISAGTLASGTVSPIEAPRSRLKSAGE